MIRFNVAEETTETLADSFLAVNDVSSSMPHVKPVSQVDRSMTKRDTEVSFTSKNTKTGPIDVIPLFADNDNDLDLFEKQKKGFQEIIHDAGEEKEPSPVCSYEARPREMSTESTRLLSDDSDYHDSLRIRVVENDEEEAVEQGPLSESDEGRSSSCFSVERDTEFTQSPEPPDNDTEQSPLPPDNHTLQDLPTIRCDFDSASMSSDHEIDVFESKKCEDHRLFVTEHPLTFSTEPSPVGSEEESELKQQDDSFRIVDDHFHQSPIQPVKPTKKPPPPRPPPPKKPDIKETVPSSKLRVNSDVEPEVEPAVEPEVKASTSTTEIKATSESLYWSVEFQLLLMFSTVIFVFNIINTSVYLSGVFHGALFVFLTACTILYLNLQSDEDSHRSRLESLNKMMAINSKPTQLAMRPPRGIEDDFGAIHFYDNPQKHQPKLTVKVHVIMDGYNIHVSVVRGTHMSYHHRLADEDSDEGAKQVTNTNMLDLRGAIVQLAPSVLSRKQQFSKKFPIKITFKYSIPDICGRHSHEVIHNNRVLYLFASTSRKKEMWFWRFQLACNATDDDSPNLTTPSHFKDYVKYMCRLISGHLVQSKNTKSVHTPKKSKKQVESHESTSSRCKDNESTCDPTAVKKIKPVFPPPPPSIDWFNAFMGRLFWDAWNEKYLCEYLHRKWQHKLEKMKTPSFMRPLKITKLSLGDHLPIVMNVSKPYVDYQGIWVEFDLDYKEGTFCITIETSLQFTVAGEKDTTDGMAGIGNSLSYTATSIKSKVKRREGDSDIDSGAEEDEERTEEPSIAITAPEPKPKVEKTSNAALPESSTSKSALLRIADKVLHSRIVRKAAQTRLGQHVTEKMNNWKLVLIVKVTSLKGKLLVNMAPPPTDRIWYGFKTMPRMTMIPTPKVGSKMFNYHMIMEWIDKKLRKEFEKRLVWPNMEDLVIPKLESGIKPEHVVVSES